MNREDYYESDLTDPDREIIRPKVKKRYDPFEYCKWAAGDWEAKFYAGTPIHDEQCEAFVKQLLNNPAWFKCKTKKIDARAVTRDNKAQGGRSQKSKK